MGGGSLTGTTGGGAGRKRPTSLRNLTPQLKVLLVQLVRLILHLFELCAKGGALPHQLLSFARQQLAFFLFPLLRPPRRFAIRLFPTLRFDVTIPHSHAHLLAGSAGLRALSVCTLRKRRRIPV